MYMDFQNALTLFSTKIKKNYYKKVSFGIHNNVLKLAESNKLYLMVMNLAPSRVLLVFPRVLCWAPHYLQCLLIDAINCVKPCADVC